MLFENRESATVLRVIFRDEVRDVEIPEGAEIERVKSSLSLLFCGNDEQAKEMLDLCADLPAGLFGLLRQGAFMEDDEDRNAIGQMASVLITLGVTLQKLTYFQGIRCLTMTWGLLNEESLAKVQAIWAIHTDDAEAP